MAPLDGDRPVARTYTWQNTTVEPAIPESERPQTYALDGSATGVD